MKRAVWILLAVIVTIAAFAGFSNWRHASAVAAEEDFIRRKIAEIGSGQLREDANHVLRRHDVKKNDWVLPRPDWPASFLPFEPVEVGVWGGQVMIITSRHMQHRCGLVIGYPSVGPGVTSIKIEDGLYYERT